MLRLRTALLMILVASYADTARAENWLSWRTWRSHWVQNNRWPEQYIEQDRIATRAPIQVMIANGWRTQNTISTYHFNEHTGELNDAGKLKLRAVLFESPAEWRTIYVLRADQPDMTAARMKSVQQIAGELLQGEPAPPMLVTTVEPRGTRGDISNGVSQRFMESAPAPVLPQATRDEN